MILAEIQTPGDFYAKVEQTDDGIRVYLSVGSAPDQSSVRTFDSTPKALRYVANLLESM